MNSDVKYQSVKLRVCQDNEDYFNDEFWEGKNFFDITGLDCVVNAVDNVNARLYVDSRCVFY